MLTRSLNPRGWQRRINVGAHRWASTSCRSHAACISPALSSGARESPIPVVLTSGAYHDAEAWRSAGVVDALTSRGYTTILLDLPGSGRAQALPSSWDASAICDDVHAALQGTKSAGLPIVVAPSFVAPLMQLYLESFALAGLVLLNPVPPDVRAYLSHVGCGPRADANDVAWWLRGCAADASSVRSRLLTPSASEEDVDVALLVLEQRLVTDPTVDGAFLCGIDAVAATLAALARETVKLEPRPVPMVVLRSGGDQLVRNAEVRRRLMHLCGYLEMLD